MGVIRVLDLPLEVRIGTLPEEHVATQTVRVDVELRVDTRAAASSDRLDATMDYLDVAGAVRQVAGTSRHLLEALLGDILGAVSALPRVRWARVRVRKYHLPGMGEVGCVEVEDEVGTQ